MAKVLDLKCIMVNSIKWFQASIFCVSALSTGQYVRGDLKQSSMHLLQSLKVKCCAFARLCILIFLNLYNLLSKTNENKRHAKQVLHMSPLILDSGVVTIILEIMPKLQHNKCLRWAPITTRISIYCSLLFISPSKRLPIYQCTLMPYIFVLFERHNTQFAHRP